MPLALFDARLLIPHPFVVPLYKTEQIMFIKLVPYCRHIFANNSTSCVCDSNFKVIVADINVVFCHPPIAASNIC